MSNQNLAVNLRLICGQYRSVVSICRSLEKYKCHLSLRNLGHSWLLGAGAGDKLLISDSQLETKSAWLAAAVAEVRARRE